MTKKMVNAAVLVAVLAVAVLAPSTTFAAGHGSPVVTVESHGSGIIQMLLNLIGFNPVSGGSKSTPVRTVPTTSVPTTDTAIWGGNGRCPYGC